MIGSRQGGRSGKSRRIPKRALIELAAGVETEAKRLEAAVDQSQERDAADLAPFESREPAHGLSLGCPTRQTEVYNSA